MPHAAAIRTGGRQGFAGPGLAMAYTLATWGGPHRPAMLAVSAAAMAVSGLLWWRADAVARSRARTPLRWAGALASLGCLAGVTHLSGGVAGPLGALLPVALIFFALITPPRGFLVIAATALALYWAVALLGEPVSLGYPLVYTLAFGGMSYLCLTHAGTLVSLRRRLATISRVDPLTGCLNRRGIEESLGAGLDEAARTGRPLAVLVADLDGFKGVNDTYGHQAGDDLLAWTARTVAAVAGEGATVGRTGGDEFAVVLPDTDGPAAAAVAGRLQEALAPVTPASVGYACHPADGAGLDELIRAADARTYHDKARRRSVPPTAEAVAVARAAAGRRRAVRVSRHERRLRSIADMGWMAATNFSIGLLYVAFFTAGAPHRGALAALSALGCASGLALVAAAPRLSRSRAALRVLMVIAVLLFPLGAAVAVLDGGAGSPLALGTLTPLPLIALGAPIRVAVPVLTGVGGLYVGIAVVGGAPSGWYVAANLLGMAGAAAVCAAQGRAAARQRRLLTQLSRTDALTGAVNRRGFEERFEAELRGGGAVALLLLDLDGFKRLNDSLGHAAGDELLRWVAATLAANVRGSDLVGRLGGDEFVVLLTGHADPAAAAHRLRAALAARTAVSVGTAVRGLHGADFDALYAHADAELYAQKPGRTAPREASAPSLTRP
ncbi:GGDEF domain-containing protein [Spirilliplanes yamanashiensis]|uniref:GGDEF domain-containing protein n=1 Tax=Spirilliplanes yamanashiensis TaxID=42233 RepID=UPI00195294F7|nr:GGDEF domain-containing protein [Spirilliplanes yamanashiensis]MDP9819397.1 diguanylate cyclase (GGDEF)-like protein [Spirilliplanes yamanashiensis]